MCAMCLKRVLLCSGPVQTCRSAVSHVHPCFSLHPDINVLHYRINASRVANYERFLFKRLFRLPPMSVSTVLLNLHQRKSKCPCHHDGGSKNITPIKATRSWWAVKNQRRVLHWEREVFGPSLVQADVDREDQRAEKDSVSLINL